VDAHGSVRRLPPPLQLSRLPPRLHCRRLPPRLLQLPRTALDKSCHSGALRSRPSARELERVVTADVLERRIGAKLEQERHRLRVSIDAVDAALREVEHALTKVETTREGYPLWLCAEHAREVIKSGQALNLRFEQELDLLALGKPDFKFVEIHARSDDLRLQSAYDRCMSSFMQDMVENYEVLRVQLVVNPMLTRRFERAKADMAERRRERHGNAEVREELRFHGSAAIEPICKGGFRMDLVGRNTGNLGFYGRGLYFGTSPDYARDYAPTVDGSSVRRVMVARVLHGKGKTVERSWAEGIECVRGACCGGPDDHDCHLSPKGNELVVFDDSHAVVEFVVDFRERSERDVSSEYE